MVDRLRVHRADHADIVRDAADMAHQVAVLHAALTVLLEIDERAGERKGGLIAAHTGQALSLADGVRQRLRMLFAEEWLRIERL